MYKDSSGVNTNLRAKNLWKIQSKKTIYIIIFNQKPTIRTVITVQITQFIRKIIDMLVDRFVFILELS